MSRRQALSSILVLFLCPIVNAQVGTPQALLPNGPTPKSPEFSWTEVQGATQYKVTVETPTYQCPGVGVVRTAGRDVASVDPKYRCSSGKCGFRPDFDSYPPVSLPQGVSGAVPQIYCARDVHNVLVVFKWSVQAFAGGTSSPTSQTLSYSRQ
jgi:hypothetical protein